MNRLFFFNEEFEKGMKFKLLKEENNKFDIDVIAVYLNDVKVSYLSNSVCIACSLTSESKDIQIQDIAYAEYMFYVSYQYNIAKIINNNENYSLFSLIWTTINFTT